MRRGVESFTFSLANELAKEIDFKIIIYSWKSKNKIDWGTWDKNIKIRNLPFSRYFQKFWAKIFYYFWIIKDNPSCIMINFLYHGESFLPKKKNYLYVLHSPATQIPKRYDYIKKNLNRYKNINFVAVSKFVRDQALSYIPEDKIKVIYNGIDTKIFRHNVKEETKIIKIISLSALERRKRLQNVILALKELDDPEIHYDIYGEGSFKSKIEDLIIEKNMGNKIKLKGLSNYPQDCLKNSDIFILLSKGEAFPIAPLEAMSCGLPIIVSNEKPYDEIISKKSGFLVNPHSKDDIITAILKLKNKSLRIQLGKISRNIIEKKFTIFTMKNKYIELISSIIDK